MTIQTMEFPVKSIKWSVYEQVTPILLQVSNGPCPLIALVNTLLLGEDILQRSENPRDPSELGNLRRLLSSHVGRSVPCADVIAALGDILLATPDLEQAVLDKLLNSLPLLHTGLEVNPNLVTGTVQNSDLSAQVFSAFGLQFVHGWCISPGNDENDIYVNDENDIYVTDEDQKRDENEAIYSIFLNHQDFNSIQDYLLQHENTPASNQVQTWLDKNSTQLTSHGLRLMHQQLHPETVSIFFRNNHFSTLYKAGDVFYVLITDGSFAKSTAYVWQSLTSISGGNDMFYSGDFTPILGPTDVPSERYEECESEDLLLVSQIQAEEDSKYASLLQKQYDRHRNPVKKADPSTKRLDKLEKRLDQLEKRSNKSNASEKFTLKSVRIARDKSKDKSKDQDLKPKESSGTLQKLKSDCVIM